MQSPWAPRIYTPRGFTREDILGGKQALDLGCGGRKLPGAVGVDSLKLPAVDIVHDLSVFPWPFADASFDLVFANHYLEHAPDVLRALGEAHRILKPSGRLVVQVPYFRSVDAFSDPTHAHYFTSASLDYVIAGTKLGEYSYTPFKYTRVGFWYGWPQRSKNPLARAFKSFISAHQHFYDQHLSLHVPMECVTWELEKV
jgi:SAM-dependent methyltransferase